MNAIDDCRIIQLPKIVDARGNVTSIEGGLSVPFVIRSVHLIYDVPSGGAVDGCAYKKSQEFVISLSGSLDVNLDDIKDTKVFSLNRPCFGLYIANMIWHRLENFSTNAVCLILGSLPYSEDDYLRDYRVFARYKERERSEDNS